MFLFCGILPNMLAEQNLNFKVLFSQFQSPISTFDCGKKCAPYNEYGVPFCCDTNHAVPTAYQQEWQYLKTNTDLWHIWEAETPDETARLRRQTPDGQVLIECLGHKRCQRDYRAITCRAFPFFPYINSDGELIGFSYYWLYEDRCWIISNLQHISQAYVFEFVTTYDQIFCEYPQERENFIYHSKMMRRVFGRKKRTIPLFHRNGNVYKITPGNGRIRRVSAENFPKHEPYKTAALMPFPDEL